MLHACPRCVDGKDIDGVKSAVNNERKRCRQRVINNKYYYATLVRLYMPWKHLAEPVRGYTVMIG